MTGRQELKSQMLVWQSRRDPQVIFAVAPLSLACIFGLHLVLDGMFLYLSVLQIGIYALLAVSSAAITALSLRDMALRQRETKILLVWLLVSCAYLLPAALSEYPYPRYILSDFVASMLPALLLLVGFRYQEFLLSRQIHFTLGALMFIAALLAVPLAEVPSRHEPPSTMLIALAWSGFFVARSMMMKRLLFVVLAVLLMLAVTSGERTAVLIWLGLGIVARAFLVARLRNLGLAALASIIVLAGVVVMFGEALILAAASTRLESLSQRELDISLLNRLLELRDVWSELTPVHWYGYGHGATFMPELSDPVRNLTADGRVHHIHFGPVLLMFRYGLPGLLLYIWLVTDVIRYAAAMKSIGFRHPHALPAFFFAVALAGYLASFLVFNIMPDPAFSYVLAGYLYLRLMQPVPMLCGAAGVGQAHQRFYTVIVGKQ